MAKRKLGRGLDMLIARGDTPAATKQETPSASGTGGGGGVLQVPPDDIELNPSQPRKQFSIAELESLKTSVARDGVLQPLLVRPVGDRYQLVAGERRLRAARELSLDTVPVILSQIGDDRLLEIALVENIHREDLNPIELAQAYRALMDLKSWTQEQLASELGVSRPNVANTVRLLELSEDMQQAIVRSQITMGHAKVLLSVPDTKVRRLLFERIGEDQMSVRELERARQGDDDDPPEDDAPSEKSGGGDRKKKKGRRGDEEKKPYLISLEEELTEALGTRVRIREKGGKGVVSVEFYSKDDFERLRSLLLGQVRA